MREQIPAYLDRVFANAPCTRKAVEMKEAILADTLEKYDDMVREGKKPQDAYRNAVGSIGNLEDLIASLRNEQPEFTPPPPPKHVVGAKHNPLFHSINSALWMLVLVVYFLLSFATGAWHITWLTFLIGIALSNILRAIFDLIGGGRS
ncbi:MAG: hypothetical protein IJW99_03885 [Clostridia bacterium]|nr:hypothetical protein [Clostridia bacterium]